MWPGALPWEVGRFTPTQVAAVLGWDIEDTVKAIPMEQRPVARPPGMTAEQATARKPQLRAVAFTKGP